MLVSAELRWFWPDEPPREIRDWFHGGDVPAGGGHELRRDRYFLHRGDPELGVKTRDEGGGGEQVEIKGLVATRPPQGLDLDVRQMEIWCKWATSVRPAGPGVLVEKRRWLRRFAVGDEVALLDADARSEPRRERPAAGCAGCNVELTKVVAPDPGDVWWTLGFEAFGGLERVCGVLTRTLQSWPPPCADPRKELSYPAWLKACYGGFG